MSKKLFKVGDYIEGYEIFGHNNNPIVHKIWLQIDSISTFKGGHAKFYGKALDSYKGARGAYINTLLGKVSHVDAELASMIDGSSRMTRLPYNTEVRYATSEAIETLELYEHNIKDVTEIELDVDKLEYPIINYLKSETEKSSIRLKYNKGHIRNNSILQSLDGREFLVLGVGKSKNSCDGREYLIYKDMNTNEILCDLLSDICITELGSEYIVLSSLTFSIQRY